MPKWLTRRGFSLVELMIVILILGLVVGLIYGIFISTRRVQTAEEKLVGLSHEVRTGLQQMVREVRMVGAFTNRVITLTGVKNSCGIINAPLESTSIEFEGDVDLDNKVERIGYVYEPSLKALQRYEYEILNETGWRAWPGRCNTPFMSTGEPVPSPQTVAYGISNLIIQYFSVANAVVTNAPDVKRVAITVTAKSAYPKEAQRTLSVDVELRNLGAEGAMGDISPPSPPPMVSAVDRGVCGYLGVTWQESPESDIAGYKVYYKPQGWGYWNGTKTVGLVTSTELGGLQNGVQYTVGVASFDTSGNISGVTNSSDIIPSDNRNPLNVINLSAVTNQTFSNITLSWLNGADTDIYSKIADDSGNRYPVSYQVFRDISNTGSFNTQIASLSPYSNTTYVDTGPLAGCTSYYYKVKTIDSCGLSNITSAYGGPLLTNIIVNTVAKPESFYSGGGTVHTVGTTGLEKGDTWSYARFSGMGNSSDSLVNSISIEYKSTMSNATCVSLTLGSKPWGTELSDFSLTPSAIGQGVSFTGSWPTVPSENGLYKDCTNYKSPSGPCLAKQEYFYRFAAYSKNRCGYYSSEPFAPDYCVSGCTDAISFPGNAGLGLTAGSACIVSPAYPYKIAGKVCDKIKIYWATKPVPADCTAYGSGPNYDFYPDEGDGGFLLYRAREDNNLFIKLAPDPVTGPLQPFYYEDGYRMGEGGICPLIEENCGGACYRDRCSYKYALAAVDCAINQSGDPSLPTGTYVEQDVVAGPYFKPGVINGPDPAVFPTVVEGSKKNKVVFWVQNTSIANLTLVGSHFNWKDTQATLAKVEIANVVGSSGLSNWKTLWYAADGGKKGISSEIANAAGVSFLPIGNYTACGNYGTQTPTIANAMLFASPPLGSGPTAKAKIRLTFNQCGSTTPQKMDDYNEQIVVGPKYRNLTSTSQGTSDGVTCEPNLTDATTTQKTAFIAYAPPAAIVNTVMQRPPSKDCPGVDPWCPSLTDTPPSGSWRTDKYLIDNTPVSVRATVIPQPGTTVAYSGDTSKYTGVILYYALTPNTNTTAPIPQDDLGNEELLMPTKTNYAGVIYNTVSMSRYPMPDPPSACSDTDTGCIYNGIIPAQANKRVWYYILAVDSKENYGMALGNNYDAFKSISEGFESGSFTGWDVTPIGAYPNVQSAIVNSGSYAANLSDGASGICPTSCYPAATTSIEKGFSIPYTSKIPKLKLQYKVSGTDNRNILSCTNEQSDGMAVSIDGTQIAYWYKDTAGWLPYEYDLSAYQGMTIPLKLSSWSCDGVGPVYYYVDDVVIVLE